MKKYYHLVYLFLFLSSCVPSKDLIYLQGKPIVNKDIQQINNTPYKLQVDDMININIKSSDQKLVAAFKKTEANSNVSSGNSNQNFGGSTGYFSDYSIDSYGNIRIPTIGNINVLGYTTVEVRTKIENELKKYIKDQESLFVTVKLSGIKYTIIGEVRDQGPKVIYQNKVSIIDAIANSGGVTDTGNRKEIEIIRNSISGTEKYTLDLTDINVFNSKVFYLKPNDYINVKPLKQKAWGTGTTGIQSLTTVISIFTLITSTIILARNL